MRGLFSVLGILTFVALPVSAQTGDGEAVDAFEAGVRAWDEQRFEDALPHFIAAYEQSGNPAVLINVAAAQAQLGRLAEAAATYRLVIASDDLRAQRHAPSARAALAELEPRLSHLAISIEGADAADVLAVDDREIAQQHRADVELDAGEHRVTVRRGERTIADETVSLGERERRELSLRVLPIAPRPEGAPAQTRDLPIAVAPALTDEPWFWGVLGGAAVVIAAVVIGIAVALSASPATYAGSFEPGQLWVR